jgi:hypothetical protein
MADKDTGYGRNWKKWLAIYAVAGVVVYGTPTSNTFSVQAVDSAGNRSPTSSVTLTDQTC